MCDLRLNTRTLHLQAPLSAAGEGRLEAVRYLHQDCGLPLSREVLCAAAGSGSVATATWLLQHGCPVGQLAYANAVRRGDLPIMRWLATQARCPVALPSYLTSCLRWGEGRAAGRPRRGSETPPRAHGMDLVPAGAGRAVASCWKPYGWWWAQAARQGQGQERRAGRSPWVPTCWSQLPPGETLHLCDTFMRRWA